jgi:hypothetical protein
LLSKNIKIKTYSTTVLPVVLYGCATWSFTLREERRLSVFEKGLLRRKFGPEKDEVTEQWRRPHNAELFTKYRSCEQIKKNKMGESCGTYGGEKSFIHEFGGET